MGPPSTSHRVFKRVLKMLSQAEAQRMIWKLTTDHVSRDCGLVKSDLRSFDVYSFDVPNRSSICCQRKLADPFTGFEDVGLWPIQALTLMSLYMHTQPTPSRSAYYNPHFSTSKTRQTCHIRPATSVTPKIVKPKSMRCYTCGRIVSILLTSTLLCTDHEGPHIQRLYWAGDRVELIFMRWYRQTSAVARPFRRWQSLSRASTIWAGLWSIRALTLISLYMLAQGGKCRQKHSACLGS